MTYHKNQKYLEEFTNPNFRAEIAKKETILSKVRRIMGDLPILNQEGEINYPLLIREWEFRYGKLRYNETVTRSARKVRKEMFPDYKEGAYGQIKQKVYKRVMV